MADWSAQRVRSRSRAAVRKREEQVEQDEMESGELNLIPYLDMVTNLMLFMLSSVQAGLVLSEINTSLPDKAPKGANVTKPDQKPEDQPLGLYVSVKRDEMIVWSVSKREGTLREPKPGYTIPRMLNTTGKACDGPYMCESNVCDFGVCLASQDTPQVVYDYRTLNTLLGNIASTHYKGKRRKADHYAIVLQADQSIPYSVIVSVMTAMRCKMAPMGQPAKACLMPNEDKAFKAKNQQFETDSAGNRLSYNTDLVDYDPERMALFPNIQFSSDFE